MDVEKLGAAFAAGDWSAVTRMCDETEIVTTASGSTLIYGRMETLVILYTSESGGQADLRAHAHDTVEQAGACYAENINAMRMEAEEVNRLSQLLTGREFVTVGNSFPDYVPGDWSAA
jgi:hypothetical protein